MCLRRPISFSFTGGISARFFALRGLAVEDLHTVSRCNLSRMSKGNTPGSVASGLAVGSRHDQFGRAKEIDRS